MEQAGARLHHTATNCLLLQKHALCQVQQTSEANQVVVNQSLGGQLAYTFIPFQAWYST